VIEGVAAHAERAFTVDTRPEVIGLVLEQERLCQGQQQRERDAHPGRGAGSGNEVRRARASHRGSVRIRGWSYRVTAPGIQAGRPSGRRPRHHPDFDPLGARAPQGPGEPSSTIAT
jgi:hypothetical protein